MSEDNIQSEESKRKTNNASRAQKLKEIDALYQAQIKRIYTDSKDKVQKIQIISKSNNSDFDRRKSTVQNQISPTPQINFQEKSLQSAKSAENLKLPESISGSRLLNQSIGSDEKVRASTFLKGQSTRTIQILRRQNENKELKIRELSNKCENLIEKLRKYLGNEQFEAEMEHMKEFADSKIQRLQNLFKIKQEEIFFKIKLQVISLLQEFSIPKVELTQINDISTEPNLFSYLAKKIKSRLKDFRSKQQQSSFEIQKDRILNQKQEQRIHYLTETNELHKLSQGKLKAKVQDLKKQLNQYLQKLKLRQQLNEESQSQVFRLKKQNQQLQNVNQKLTSSMRSANGDRSEDKRVWMAKDKQMKELLNNYFVQKQKLQTLLQQKDGQIQENHIKQKFLQQENERLNRDLVRWKERYQWLQKEKDIRLKEVQQERNSLLADFQQYKLQHNQGILLNHKKQIGQTLRKLEEYQRAYEAIQLNLDEERRLLQVCEDKNQQKIEKMEKQWLQRVKKLQRMKEEQIYQMGQDFEGRISQVRQQLSKKEQLLSQEMQARMKALLAQKDKKITQQLIQVQTQNDQLRREIDDLNKIIEVKDSLINVINSKRL